MKDKTMDGERNNHSKGGDARSHCDDTHAPGDWITESLKKVYQDTAQEALPDDMLDLLRQLDAEETRNNPAETNT